MEWTQERLDALAQSVELMASMQRDGEAKTRQGFEVVLTLHRENEALLKRVMEANIRLARIMEAHDLSIDNHEGRITDLEKGRR